MEKIPFVERSVCVFDESKSRLYGFYTGDVDKKILHEKLSDMLPAFMVPERLVKKEEFALTKNGKADRKALLEEIHRRSYAGR